MSRIFMHPYRGLKCCCRNDRSHWAGLPAHLVHLIWHKLEEICSTEELINIRLVCKAWLAAFNDYPGGFTCALMHETDAASIAKIMPKMQSLVLDAILTDGDFLDPHDLSPCSHLTRLDVRPRRRHRGIGLEEMMSTCFDPACLPHGLRELHLEGLTIELHCALRLSCTHLTRLALECEDYLYIRLEGLLKHLPELKVSILCHSQSQGSMSKVKELYFFLRR